MMNGTETMLCRRMANVLWNLAQRQAQSEMTFTERDAEVARLHAELDEMTRAWRQALAAARKETP